MEQTKHLKISFILFLLFLQGCSTEALKSQEPIKYTRPYQLPPAEDQFSKIKDNELDLKTKKSVSIKVNNKD